MSLPVRFNTHTNIEIRKGVTFLLSVPVLDEDEDPIDLTTYTARMEIRESLYDNTVLVDLSDTNGLFLSTGNVAVTIEGTVSAAIEIERGVYALEVTDGNGIITRLREGIVRFLRRGIL